MPLCPILHSLVSLTMTEQCFWGYRKGKYATYLVKLIIIGATEVFQIIEKVNMLNRSTEIGEAEVSQGIEKANW